MTTDPIVAAADPEANADDTFVHFYDQHPTKEDLMGESAAQSRLILYLLNVLIWLYRAEECFVVSNLNIYRERRRHEYPLAPDVAVFKGVSVPNWNARTLRSWRLYEPNRPAPTVVFELSSAETWKTDLKEKPASYATLGVREYYAYDPNDPPYWPKRMGRLRGWHLDGGVMIEQPKDAQGRIWSDELASWVVPDVPWLRLFTRDGQLRLTEAEAERAAKEAERTAKEVAQAEQAAAKLAQAAERAAREHEQAAKEAERAAKEREQAAKEAERAAKEAAWAKLRELGVDPETL